MLVGLPVGQVAQNLRQGFRPSLAGSTGTGGQLGEAHRLRGHGLSFRADYGASINQYRSPTLTATMGGLALKSVPRENG